MNILFYTFSKMFVKIVFIFTIFSMIGYHKVLADTSVKNVIKVIDEFRITDFEDVNLNCYFSMLYYIVGGYYNPHTNKGVIDAVELDAKMIEIHDYYFYLLTLTTEKIENNFNDNLWDLYMLIKNWETHRNRSDIQTKANVMLKTSDEKYIMAYRKLITKNTEEIAEQNLANIFVSYNICQIILEKISRDFEKDLGESIVIHFKYKGINTVDFPGVIMKLMTKDELTHFKLAESKEHEEHKFKYFGLGNVRELEGQKIIVRTMEQTLSEIYLGIIYVINKVKLFNLKPGDNTNIVLQEDSYITGLKLYSMYKIFKIITDVSKNLMYLLLRYYKNTHYPSYTSFLETFQYKWSKLFLKNGEHAMPVHKSPKESNIPENGRLIKNSVVEPSMINYYAIMFEKDWFEKINYSADQDTIFLMELRGWLELIKYYTISMLNSKYTRNHDVENIHQLNQDFIESHKFDVDINKIK